MLFRKLNRFVFFLFMAFIFGTTSVMGVRDAEQSDSFESAKSSASTSSEQGPQDNIVIAMPQDVQQLEVEEEENQPKCNEECREKTLGIIAGTICVLVCLSVIVGTPILLATTLGSIQPQLCPDICKNNPGYYAPIKGAKYNNTYAYVHCNGTVDHDLRKRGLPGAVVLLVAAGNSKSTPKPRTYYKYGWICEEAAINPLTTAILEVENSTESVATDTLPPLVGITETAKE